MITLHSQLHGAAGAGLESLPFRSVQSALPSLLPLAPSPEASCSLFAVDGATPQKEGWEERCAGCPGSERSRTVGEAQIQGELPG